MKVLILFGSVSLFALAGCVGDDPIYSSLYGQDRDRDDARDAEVPAPIPASSSSGETPDARPASSSSSSGSAPDAGPSSSSGGSSSSSSSSGSVNTSSSSGSVPDAGPTLLSNKVLTLDNGTTCSAENWRNQANGQGCGFDNNLQTPYAWKAPRASADRCSASEIAAFADRFEGYTSTVSANCETCLVSEWGVTSRGPVVTTLRGHLVVNTGGCRYGQGQETWKKQIGYYEWHAEQCAVEVCDSAKTEEDFQLCRLSTFRGSGTSECDVVALESYHAVSRFEAVQSLSESCGDSAYEERDLPSPETTVRERFVAAATVMCGN